MIISSWRRLSGGSATRDTARRAIVACSGGADSSALVLALSTLTPGPLVVHAVHDMRPRPDAEADRDAVAGLAAALKLDFHVVETPTAALPGNAEANARRARYRALAKHAADASIAWVLTGHHADDQLETVLMRLLRGAGPRGLAGIPPTRALSPAVTLARPMLDISRQACVELCLSCGWTPRQDHTNTDTTRTRAAIRARVAPALRSIHHDAPRRVARTAEVLREAADAIDAIAADLWSGHAPHPTGACVDRDLLAGQPEAVLVALLDHAHRELVGRQGLDLRRAQTARSIAKAITGSSPHSRNFQHGALSVRLTPRNLILAPIRQSPHPDVGT